MRKYWIQLRSSLWFVPALLVLAAIALALGLVELDVHFGDRIGSGKWRPLLGAKAEGARGVLTAIASSMITVAGVVFSVTIVTLSLASTQYTPRILRNFMRDRANQLVLGVFVGIYVYCLIVLRTIQPSDQLGGFVPLLSVAFAVLLALLSIGCLIFFIHHVATSIQASYILDVITKETLSAIEHLFPHELNQAEADQSAAAPQQDSACNPIMAPVTGYIQNVDADKLWQLASRLDTVLRLEKGIGDFVVEGSPLIWSARELEEETIAGLRAAYAIGNFRTVDQDASFGIRQIVDIAMKALSPGVNDTSTAVSCVDYLSAILSRLAGRRMQTPYGTVGEKLRVIAPVPLFSKFVADSLDEIRLSAAGNASIILQMLRLLVRVAPATRNADQMLVLLEHARNIRELADDTVRAPYDRSRIQEELTKVRGALRAGERLQPLPNHSSEVFK